MSSLHPGSPCCSDNCLNTGLFVGICSICQVSQKPEDIKKSFYHLTVFICLVNSRVDPSEEIANKDADQLIWKMLQRQEAKLSINKSEDFGKECELLEINGVLSGILGFKYLFFYLLFCDLGNLPKIKPQSMLILFPSSCIYSIVFFYSYGKCIHTRAHSHTHSESKTKTPVAY